MLGGSILGLSFLGRRAPREVFAYILFKQHEVLENQVGLGSHERDGPGPRNAIRERLDDTAPAIAREMAAFAWAIARLVPVAP